MRSLLRPSTLPDTDLTVWLLPQMSPFRLETPLTHVHCPVLLSLAPWQVAPATHTWSSRQKSPRAISVQRDERYLLRKKKSAPVAHCSHQQSTGPLQRATLCTLYQQKQERRFQLKGHKSDIHSNLYNSKNKCSAIMRRLTLITFIVFANMSNSIIFTA